MMNKENGKSRESGETEPNRYVERLVPQVLREEMLKNTESISIDAYQMIGINLAAMRDDEQIDALLDLLGIENLQLMPRGDGYFVGLHLGERGALFESLTQQMQLISDRLEDKGISIQESMMISVGDTPKIPLEFEKIEVDGITHWAQKPIADDAALAGALGAKLLGQSTLEGWFDDGLPLVEVSSNAVRDAKEVSIKGQRRYMSQVKIAELSTLRLGGDLNENMYDPKHVMDFYNYEFGSYLPFGSLAEFDLKEGVNMVSLGERLVGRLDSNAGFKQVFNAVDVTGMSTLVSVLQKFEDNPELYARMQDVLGIFLNIVQKKYTEILVGTGFWVNEYGGDGGVGISHLKGEDLKDANKLENMVKGLFDVEASFHDLWKSIDDGDLGDDAKLFKKEYLSESTRDVPQMKVGAGIGDVGLEVFLGKRSGFVKMHAEVGPILLNQGLEAVKRWREEGKQALQTAESRKDDIKDNASMSLKKWTDYQVVYLDTEMWQHMGKTVRASFFTNNGIDVERVFDRELNQEVYFLVRDREKSWLD